MKEKLLELAIKELGYKEGYNNDTIYGTWYGLPNQPWCAMFISYIANKASISTDIIPRMASCTLACNWFKQRGKFKPNGYKPKKGDICFIIWTKGEPSPDHIGIVEDFDGKTVTTIEGNRNDTVGRYVYDINDWHIFGYGIPEYNQNVNNNSTSDNNDSGNRQEVKELQNILNTIYKVGLEEDNKFGKLTYGVIKNKVALKYGSTGLLVRWFQKRLIQEGYNIGNTGLNKDGVDGDFKTKTQEAVKKFQKDHKILIDGIVGIDTIYNMVKMHNKMYI